MEQRQERSDHQQSGRSKNLRKENRTPVCHYRKCSGERPRSVTRHFKNTQRRGSKKPRQKFGLGPCGRVRAKSGRITRSEKMHPIRWPGMVSISLQRKRRISKNRVPWQGDRARSNLSAVTREVEGQYVQEKRKKERPVGRGVELHVEAGTRAA